MINADQTLEVIGRGAVTIVDGSEIVTDSYQTKGHRPMMVSGAILHSLPAGYRFNLTTRSLLSGPTEAVAKVPRAMETARKRLHRLSKEIASEGADSFVVDRKERKARDQLPEASE